MNKKEQLQQEISELQKKLEDKQKELNYWSEPYVLQEVAYTLGHFDDTPLNNRRVITLFHLVQQVTNDMSCQGLIMDYSFHFDADENKYSCYEDLRINNYRGTVRACKSVAEFICDLLNTGRFEL